MFEFALLSPPVDIEYVLIDDPDETFALESADNVVLLLLLSAPVLLLEASVVLDTDEIEAAAAAAAKIKRMIFSSFETRPFKSSTPY